MDKLCHSPILIRMRSLKCNPDSHSIRSCGYPRCAVLGKVTVYGACFCCLLSQGRIFGVFVRVAHAFGNRRGTHLHSVIAIILFLFLHVQGKIIAFHCQFSTLSVFRDRVLATQASGFALSIQICGFLGLPCFLCFCRVLFLVKGKRVGAQVRMMRHSMVAVVNSSMSGISRRVSKTQ